MTQQETVKQALRRLCAWYQQGHRDLPWRHTRDPYAVWISEIMLQQTRVQAVIPYYERFMRELPTVQALAEVPEEQLLKLWEWLGYYFRARNLQKAARTVCAEFDGYMPCDRDALLTLSGIGAYTAGAAHSPVRRSAHRPSHPAPSMPDCSLRDTRAASRAAIPAPPAV